MIKCHCALVICLRPPVLNVRCSLFIVFLVDWCGQFRIILFIGLRFSRNKYQINWYYYLLMNIPRTASDPIVESTWKIDEEGISFTFFCCCRRIILLLVTHNGALNSSDMLELDWKHLPTNSKWRNTYLGQNVEHFVN